MRFLDPNGQHHTGRNGTLTWAHQSVVTCLLLNCQQGAWREFMKAMDEDDAAVKAGGARHPIFIMSNHVSLLDTIVVSCFIPVRAVVRVRYYMMSRLLKIPMLGTIARASGQFPVFFSSDEDGKFSVCHSPAAPVPSGAAWC